MNPVPRVAMAVLGLLAACGGCAYGVLSPGVGDGRALLIPTTVNDTRWRGVEASSTQSLRSQAARQLDVELTTGPAYDLMLTTRFVDIGRRATIGNRDGGFTVGTAQVRLAWELTSAHGEILAKGQSDRELEFLTGSEDVELAIARIVDEMAEQIVLEVASDLTTRGSVSNDTE